jgi:hypothetical protein
MNYKGLTISFWQAPNPMSNKHIQAGTVAKAPDWNPEFRIEERISVIVGTTENQDHGVIIKITTITIAIKSH